MGTYTKQISSYKVNLVAHELQLSDAERQELKSILDFNLFHNLALEHGFRHISASHEINLNEYSLEKLWSDRFSDFCSKELLTEDHIVTEKRVKWYFVYTLETESGVVLDTSKVSLNHLISDLSLRRNS
jgi:hypothetical protein